VPLRPRARARRGRHPPGRPKQAHPNPWPRRSIADALLGGGFLESEADVNRGAEDADRVAAGTGRRGLQDWFIRLAGSVGLKNAETEMKERYEQALRENRSVIAALAPTEERKDLAADIFRRCGGRFINFFGHLNVERIAQ
jgi:hypothetical protein